MNDLARLSQRVFNVPLMIRPEKAEIIAAALADRIGLARLDSMNGTTLEAAELRRLADDATSSSPRRKFKGYKVEDAAAIFSIEGSLVQKLGGADPYSGMMGYDQIEKRLDEAVADPAVKGVFVEYDSGGGEVAGCFALARKMLAMRGNGKPIVAHINENSCSASYALTCPADIVFMADTGITGSIGVWTMLVDFTKALKKGGISAQMIRAGERKARGGPYEVADQATVDKLLAWVEDTRQIFAGFVATARGLKIEDVLSQEGDWYYGEEAVARGLVDRIAGRDEALAWFKAELAKS